MRLHKRLVRESKASGKRFYRHDLPVPQRALDALGWSTSTNLVCAVEGDKLVVRRAPR